MSSTDSDASDKAEEFIKLIEGYAEAVHDDRLDEANLKALQAMVYVAEHVDEQVDPDLPLLNEASDCEERADWPGAEAIYKQRVVSALQSGEPVDLRSAYLGLSGFYSLLDKHAEAVEYSLLAIEAARKSDSEAAFGICADVHASCARAVGKIDEAIETVQEALALLPKDDHIYDLMVAGLRVELAECYRSAGNVEAASEELDSAIPVLERHAKMFIAAGAKSNLATALIVRARILTALGDTKSADTLWKRAMRLAREVAALPHCSGAAARKSLARKLEEWSEFLRNTGKLRKSARAASESKQIRQRIGL